MPGDLHATPTTASQPTAHRARAEPRLAAQPSSPPAQPRRQLNRPTFRTMLQTAQAAPQHQ
eukprot:13621752-Alexandrium_andersonii.AAC.1